jgi:hypothetical protein
MKKVILLVAVAFAFASCSKEKQLTRTLSGKWNIDAVTYSAVPSAFPTTISGTGQSVSGYLTFDKKTLASDYNVSFSTQATTLFGTTIPSTPVAVAGTGTFTNTENAFTITKSDNSSKLDFAILNNNKTTMKWQTTTTDTISMLPVTVTLTIDATKQ